MIKIGFFSTISSGDIDELKQLTVNINNSLEPLEITLKDGGKIRFRGMIDRVEINDDNSKIVVTDYKTGSPTPYSNMGKDPLDGGKRLQLPIYAITVSQATEITGDIPTNTDGGLLAM